MKSKFNLVLILLAGLSMNPAAYADEPNDAADATITVVDEGATPDDVVKVIELPQPAAATGGDKSSKGGATATAAKDKSGGTGHESGKQVSEEARANNGAQVREDAKQQAHNDARNDNAKDKKDKQPH